MYALLALTAVDLGLSGRTPPTIGLAALRCAAVVAIMLIFTVAVLAPCPYHRIDRWNIAKRIALLALSSSAAVMTMCLSLAEVGVVGARDGVDSIASLLLVLLPLCFALVLVAFLLSRGTGCCRRCAFSARERKVKQRAAIEKRDAEEAAEALACAFAFREEVRRASALPGTPQGRTSILSAEAIGAALDWVGGTTGERSAAGGGAARASLDFFEPHIRTIEARKRADGISIEMARMHENPLRTTERTERATGGGGGGGESSDSPY